MKCDEKMNVSELRNKNCLVLNSL